MEEFSFSVFNDKFYSKSNSDDIFVFYTDYISELKKDGRIGNATVYEYSLKSMQSFHVGIRLSFKDITPAFLKKYERFMTAKGKSLTSTAMFLRCLRYLYNRAVVKGIISRAQYPFGEPDDGKYRIPQPENIKKALKLADIGKIFHYKPIEGSPEHFYRDLWVFSYLANGINMKDICLLKYKNIKGERIYFIRAKTARTTRNPKPIDIIITEEVRQIIDHWGCQPAYPDSFIFPILTKGLTPDREQAAIKQTTKQANKYIKRIAEKLSIPDNISTYSARHSFATVLKRAGVNISFISDALGHADMKTTESYLGSFEDDQKKEIAKKLTDW
jgi:integrase